MQRRVDQIAQRGQPARIERDVTPGTLVVPARVEPRRADVAGGIDHRDAARRTARTRTQLLVYGVQESKPFARHQACIGVNNRNAWGGDLG